MLASLTTVSVGGHETQENPERRRVRNGLAHRRRWSIGRAQKSLLSLRSNAVLWLQCRPNPAVLGYQAARVVHSRPSRSTRPGSTAWTLFILLTATYFIQIYGVSSYSMDLNYAPYRCRLVERLHAPAYRRSSH